MMGVCVCACVFAQGQVEHSVTSGKVQTMRSDMVCVCVRYCVWVSGWFSWASGTSHILAFLTRLFSATLETIEGGNKRLIYYAPVLLMLVGV